MPTEIQTHDAPSGSALSERGWPMGRACIRDMLVGRCLLTR